MSSKQDWLLEMQLRAWGVEMKLPEGGSGGQSEENEKQALQN